VGVVSRRLVRVGREVVGVIRWWRSRRRDILMV
jgi:hypothetical protein